MMPASEDSMLFAIALAHLAALVAVLHGRLFLRFPWLTAHLAAEGISQVIDVALAGLPERNMIWMMLQIPRLVIRGAVVREVWRATSGELHKQEAKFLGMACVAVSGLLCCIGIAWTLPLENTWQWIGGAFNAFALSRQYVLLIFATWLFVSQAYLWKRTNWRDPNLLLYRVTATLGAAIIFFAGSFVRGGIGYELSESPLVHYQDWIHAGRIQCIYTFLLLVLFAWAVKPEVGASGRSEAGAD